MEKKVWLVTGASSGLGKALVNQLMRSEQQVLASFRNPEQVKAFNQEYQSAGHHAFFLDLSQSHQIPQHLSNLLEKHPQIDVLINNAGVGFLGAIEEASEEEIRSLFEVNFFGPLALTRAVLPSMRRRGAGHLIQISSHAGVKAFAGFGIYNASKFALEGASEALAQEIQPLGLRLSIVEPGPFRTNFAGNQIPQAAQRLEDYDSTAGTFRQKLLSVDGLQEGDPQKAAQAIIALASEDPKGLRIPLGRVAIGTIQSKIDQLQEDLDHHREIAQSVVFG